MSKLAPLFAILFTLALAGPTIEASGHAAPSIEIPGVGYGPIIEPHGVGYGPIIEPHGSSL